LVPVGLTHSAQIRIAAALPALGEQHDAVDRFVCPRGELLLHGNGLLVARAGRPPGRIAALSWLKAHEALLSKNRLDMDMILLKGVDCQPGLLPRMVVRAARQKACRCKGYAFGCS
jgi:hypothetical protein